MLEASAVTEVAVKKAKITRYIIIIQRGADLYISFLSNPPINMTSDSDIQSDAGTNNDDEFSIMSNLDSDFDMTEDNSFRTPS